MADARHTRRVERAARTRARNVDLRGPTIRLTHVEKEDARAVRGRRTLAEAFRGVPNRGQFLARADAFELAPGNTRVLRAFATPSNESISSRAGGERILLFWYRHDTTVDPPRRGVPVSVKTRDGRDLEIVPVEDATEGGSTTRLEGKRQKRTCTGMVTAYVR